MCKRFAVPLVAIVAAVVFYFQDIILSTVNLIAEYGVHGIVLIESNNRVILKKTTIKPDNPQFVCASLVKQITSTLILRECERDIIKLDEKANTYLKESQKIDDRIEVQHLLSHCSGLQEDNTVEFDPGSAYKYSNRSYVVLGMILENTTKSSFMELAQNLLLEQSMLDSFLIDAPTLPEIQQKHPKLILSSIANKVHFPHYRKGNQQIFPRNPCGGLISTAEDLSKWNMQLHNGKILSDKWYQCMIHPRAKSNFPEGYYGYGLCRYSKKEIYSIGYACGYKATMSYFPKSQISLVILENTTCGNYQKDFRYHRWIRFLTKLIIQ